MDKVDMVLLNLMDRTPHKEYKYCVGLFFYFQ